jgi:two-component system phosphate regulon sensor histidine kinase PhoR
MAFIFKKTYKFASITSISITLILSLLLGGFLYSKDMSSYWELLVFSIGCFFISFFIIQHRVEKFIYNRVKKSMIM